MALPGVTLNVLDGNLSLQPASNERVVLYVGCCLGGTPDTLYTFGDSATMTTSLVGGELLEAAGYALDTSGGIVMCMPLTPGTEGGLSSVTHVGTGTATMTVSAAPHAALVISCTTGGTLGTAKFTFKIGTAAASQPVTSASGWSSTGYLVPGTYVTVVFTAGTYATDDVYTISTLGAVTHDAGTGPDVPTFTASPVDYYEPKVTISKAGALATMQFTYALDYGVNNSTANTSAAILSTAGGTYAIPNTGIVLTFSGTFVAGDTYSFTTAGPAGSDLSTALTALETTYLAQATYSMVSIVGYSASASAWATQCGTLETAATTLFSSGVYVRFFNGCPTVGTILPNAGSVTVDSADTDSTVIAARIGISAPHVAPCAGDAALTSPITGLTLRRNASWLAAARAASVEASQNIAFVGLGGLPGVVSLFRDENSTPGFDAAGINCLRTYSGSGANGFYFTDGLTGTVSTSDYYRLTNARVMDRGCVITRANALPLVQSKIPTTTRNNISGVIKELKAQQIEAKVNGALQADLVLTDPADAVASSVSVNRTHDILADGNLIIGVSIQPFAYARTITVNIGMSVAA